MMTTPASSRAATFTTRLDKHLINAAGNSVRHLIISVTAPVAEETGRSRPPLNLGLVIDASGSMNGPPLDAAKEAACRVIDTLKTGDHLSIVSFAREAITHLEPTLMDGPGKRAANRAVLPLLTRGNTNLERGWLSGCEHVARRKAMAEAAERNQVMLLSDGHANAGECNPDILASHAHALRERGVSTSTVGIGLHYSPSQLQAIAEAGGGRMHDAETPAEILEIIAAELDEAITTAAENMALRLRLPSGVEAEVFGTAPATRQGDDFVIVLGSMRSGASRDIVVKLTWPAGRVDNSLSITGSASWQTPGQPAAEQCALPACDLTFAASAGCHLQPLDFELAAIVAEQWKHHIYRVGVMLNQDGSLDEAVDFATGQLRAFERYCRRVPGLEHLPEELQIFSTSMYRRYDAISSKEVMLHTYKSSRHERDRRSVARSPSLRFIQEMARGVEDPS